MSKESSTNDSDFDSMMPGVKRLENDRINVYQQRPRNPGKSPQQLESHNTDFSHMSFDEQLETTESFFDHGIQRKLQRKIRQGQLSIGNCLDLHGCTQKSAYVELAHFLADAVAAGHKLVIIIHGKGQRSQNSAVLKPLVLHWLSQQSSVLAWCPAQPRDGGSGASYVYLR